ncbi:hypothetical protein Nepgr_021152 [Nepenthes gracilis]|uniref:Uncharacterized protein n=1 Tax=Nepenthes gracilis TaxID=150966 RepID=A0AAD3T0C6_NEPGR|nr:hypothetical protein Nepgr_021152 [Nepenthes gracilis]
MSTMDLSPNRLQKSPLKISHRLHRFCMIQLWTPWLLGSPRTWNSCLIGTRYSPDLRGCSVDLRVGRILPHLTLEVDATLVDWDDLLSSFLVRLQRGDDADAFGH